MEKYLNILDEIPNKLKERIFEEKIEIAKKLIKAGISIDIIKQFTSLSEEKIKGLLTS